MQRLETTSTPTIKLEDKQPELRPNAVRALAFKWIRIIWKCWQSRTPYNEVIYLESLRKKGSSLLKFVADYQQ